MEQYEDLYIEIIEFENVDVITDSGDVDTDIVIQ